MSEETSTTTLPERPLSLTLLPAKSGEDGQFELISDNPFPPLDSEENQIRLFELAPGTDNEEFTGSYKVIDLDETDVKYQTISYVWGDVTEPAFVTVDGFKIHVTLNLLTALKRIRHPTETTTLWIDSICINQQDDQEKTEQVNLMHRIYKECARCLIWLGEVSVIEGEETEEEAHIGAQGVFDAIRVWSDMDDEIELPSTLLTMEDQIRAGKALKKLMDSPWWSRIWTIQEALAPRKARIIWGPHRLPWALMHYAAENCIDDYHPGRGLDWDAFFPTGDNGFFTAPISGLGIAKEWKDENPRPIEMLWRFRYRQASDPRDKVFALFGLDRDDWSFLPGITEGNYYELDVVDLFKKVTLDLIQDAANDGDDRGLHALIGLRGEKKAIPGLPSWTVDWTKAEESLAQFWVHNYFIWQFTADTGLPRLDVDELTASEDSSIIRLNGIFFDEVAVCSEPMTEDQDLEAVTEMMLALLSKYRQYRIDNKDEDVPEEEMKTTEEYEEEFEQLMDMSFTGEDQDEYWLENYWTAQRIFITATGCLGLGPYTLEPDDEIWVFSGGRYPFAMREWGVVADDDWSNVGEAEDYEMVGDVFLPAIMDGEAVEPRMNKQRFINVH